MDESVYSFLSFIRVTVVSFKSDVDLTVALVLGKECNGKISRGWQFVEPFLTNCYVFVLAVGKICQAFKNLMERMYASHKCLNVFDVIVSSF